MAASRRLSDRPTDYPKATSAPVITPPVITAPVITAPIESRLARVRHCGMPMLPALLPPCERAGWWNSPRAEDDIRRWDLPLMSATPSTVEALDERLHL
eukprot:3557506-Prymnesium_polylepis.1